MNNFALVLISVLILSCKSATLNCKGNIDYDLFDFSELAKPEYYIIKDFNG